MALTGHYLTRAQILLLSRQGAEEQAWASFRAGGWEAREDPEALLLKARLLKDAAVRAVGKERQRLFVSAAAAYAAAARGRSTYALINAASLSALGNDRDLASQRAREVLAMLQRADHEPDTPYWLGATRAEALLLLGQVAAAERALAEAIAGAPHAWEDHAITLRQFTLLLQHIEADCSWLDAYRPGPVMHFSGVMGIDPDDPIAARHISSSVQAVRPSSGFGALAAGADILVAEALLSCGGDLHVVLPTDPETFRAESVTAFGAAWGSRFEDLLGRAASVEVTSPARHLSQPSVEYADQIAMGMAIGRASALATRPVAIRILGKDGAKRRPEADLLWTSAAFDISVVEVSRSSAGTTRLATAGDDQLICLLAVCGHGRVMAEAAGGRRINLPQEGCDLFAYERMCDAIGAARNLLTNSGSRAGLDFRIVSELPGPADLAPAVAAAQSTDAGSIAATRRAAIVARLHCPDASADLAGEVRTAFGVEEIWRLLATGRGF